MLGLLAKAGKFLAPYSGEVVAWWSAKKALHPLIATASSVGGSVAVGVGTATVAGASLAASAAMMVGGLAVVGLVGYGVYKLFSHSDEAAAPVMVNNTPHISMGAAPGLQPALAQNVGYSYGQPMGNNITAANYASVGNLQQVQQQNAWQDYVSSGRQQQAALQNQL